MSLRHAGIDSQITPGLIECLGGMPFGAGHFRFGDMPMFFPSTPALEPDSAVSRALDILGWTCEETRAACDGGADEALLRLRQAALPAQVGPINNQWLTYHPYHAQLNGVDHYITVLEIRADTVRVHDSAGYPNATLPIDDFARAWSAQGINYGPNARPLAYVLRSNFRQVEPLTYEKILQRGITALRDQLAFRLDGPEAFSGPAAHRAAAEDVRKGRGDELRDHLIHFSLPLGARGSLDGAIFLAAGGYMSGANCMERKARVYGAALYHAVHRQWEALAAQFEQLAEVEHEFVNVMR
jgi:hypothetical protein